MLEKSWWLRISPMFPSRQSPKIWGEACAEESCEQILFHGSSVEAVVEFGDITFEVFAFDPMVGSEQEPLQVGQRDMDPGEELVGGLVLLGQLDGGVGEAVLLDMPVSVPAIGQHMAAGFNLGLEEAIQTAGAGYWHVGQNGFAHTAIE